MSPHSSEITEMDARFKDLIEQLAARAPVDDLTDAEIDREVRAVRAEDQPHRLREGASSEDIVAETLPMVLRID